MPEHQDSTQPIRILSLVLGAALGLAGMTTAYTWLVYVAMGVLAVGAILAIIRRIKIRKSAAS